ncbi:MAG: hypothetical protein PHS80_00025 [Methanothrix sp.]|nr:hypothetical protein [Bacteroidales bacterium]MDD2753886.1 hypothetical protein [Methanothrix sp.]
MDLGEFIKGRWIPYPTTPEKLEIGVSIKIEGLDEIEERLKQVKVDMGIINQATERYTHPDQNNSEEYNLKRHVLRRFIRAIVNPHQKELEV